METVEQISERIKREKMAATRRHWLAAMEKQTQPSALSTTSPGLPSGVVPALGNSTIWRLHQLKDTSECMSVKDAYRTANSLHSRFDEVRDPADATWGELCSAREQLQASLDRGTPVDKLLNAKAVSTLASMYEQLGDYDKAQSMLLSLCPSLPLTRSKLDGLCTRHEIDALLDYLRFSAVTGRDLDRAEMAARILPWATVDIPNSEECRLSALFSLVQILNCRGDHEDASKHLRIFEAISPATPYDSEFILQKAMITTGQGSQAEAQALFVDSFVLSSLIAGAWHYQTLDILYHFGRALKIWGQHQAALKIFTECCQGLYYTLGPLHPCSVRVRSELELCDGANVVMQSLHQLGHAHYSPRRKWSVAYEHKFLVTAVETLKPLTGIDYQRISNILEELLKEGRHKTRVKFNAQRCIARCSLEQGKPATASSLLFPLYRSIDAVSSGLAGVETYRAVLASDEAICFADAKDEFARRRSKLVFLGFRDFRRSRSYQVKAVLRRLTSYQLTHFTRDEVFSDPPLVTEISRESLGSGTYATVDTVQVGKTLYARKLINLSRQHQHQNRFQEEIQKEVQIMNALDHPHVVRVLLTYREARRFSIIMRPLADCDLETYLASKICSTTQELHLIWKWVVCLVNTLAFIHSKGIRHKDIKPRNILVKGEKVYFTDFGSGHMFDDGGNSTTDGIAYGHTRAYCAPEVIKNDNRNRSSDVFSLGCVLVEMAVWGSDVSMSDYFSGIRADKDNTKTVQYHDSINRISAWFQSTTQLTQRTKDIYYQALVYMIRKKPDTRWTAVQASRVIGQIVPPECVKCGIDLWVSDAA